MCDSCGFHACRTHELPADAYDPLVREKPASAAAPPQLVLVATSWFLALTCLWPHRLNRFNVGCSIFEQGRYALILQHHAIAGKLRRERTHTFFTRAIHGR